ncbi:MAG: pyridoxal phosphate-dependent aminotransferase [Candidatus Zixiibacteriota bacterium]|nr:MAG: pyridoxal phosphate-dependent aminotransferase [candidate division Zixibacteria bacterium]
MVIKKAVIDKANRLYKMAPDIFSFTREKPRPSPLKKTRLLDLARFRWPVSMDSGSVPGEKQFAPADRAKLDELKEALSQWFSDHRQVKISGDREIFIGAGISSLILNIGLAFIDNGDIVFVPELGVPLYKKVTAACGGEPVHYSVTPKTGWRPDFERINTRLGRVARLLFLNSPHNPTGAALNEKETGDLVWMAARENTVIINDAAYQSVDARTPTSLLAVDGGKKVGAEVYSFSYLLGLPPLPFGFVAGNRDVISGLEAVSGLMPAFIPEYYVDLALRALRMYPGDGLKLARDRMHRCEAEVAGLLNLLALEKSGYDTVPFVWAQIAGRRSARTQAGILYRRMRVLVAPGTSFGDSGEGFLRLSLTAEPEDYRAACERIRQRGRILKVGDES